MPRSVDEIQDERDELIAEKDRIEAVMADIEAQLVASKADRGRGLWVDQTWLESATKAKKMNGRAHQKCCHKLGELRREMKAVNTAGSDKDGALVRIAWAADRLQCDLTEDDADDMWEVIEQNVTHLDERHPDWRQWRHYSAPMSKA